MTPMSSDPSISKSTPRPRPKEPAVDDRRRHRQRRTAAEIPTAIRLPAVRPDGTGGQPQVGHRRSRRGCGPDAARAVRPRHHRRRRWAIQLDRIASVAPTSRATTFFTLPLQTTVYFSDQWQRAVSFSQALEDHRREGTFEQRLRQRHGPVRLRLRLREDPHRRDARRLPELPSPIPTTIRANVGRAFVVGGRRCPRQRDRLPPRMVPLVQLRAGARMAWFDARIQEIPGPAVHLPSRPHTRPSCSAPRRVSSWRPGPGRTSSSPSGSAPAAPTPCADTTT